jgi:coproporphyrinogen III oxidase-like Fe-S oxidoreductase
MGKSAVERSPNRKQIENMILEGETDRAISEWTKTKDNPIGKTAINSYRKKYNDKKKATIKYQEKKSQERLDNATDKIVSDLEYCDSLVQIASKAGLEVDENISKLDVNKLALVAIKTKNEIIKQGSDDDKEFTIRIVGVDSDDNRDNLETE